MRLVIDSQELMDELLAGGVPVDSIGSNPIGGTFDAADIMGKDLGLFMPIVINNKVVGVKKVADCAGLYFVDLKANVLRPLSEHPDNAL